MSGRRGWRIERCRGALPGGGNFGVRRGKLAAEFLNLLARTRRVIADVAQHGAELAHLRLEFAERITQSFRLRQ